MSGEKREFLYGLEERQNSQLKLQPQQRHAASNHGKKSVKRQSWKKRGEQGQKTEAVVKVVDINGRMCEEQSVTWAELLDSSTVTRCVDW